MPLFRPVACPAPAIPPGARSALVNQMKIKVLATLNMVWALAIWRGVSAARRSVPDSSGWDGENEVTNVRQVVYEADPDQHPGDVEQDMHHGRPEGLAGLADSGQQGRDAGADVGAERQRDAGRQGDEALARHDDDDAGGGRRGLDQRR